ncbi:eukaryotic translation initiation factor 3 subunit A [Coemansia sp. BCRC 34490]|nr:eukaryotic translation initiation factor 3 subunit A [Coemansia sp. BCRC 34490]
MSPAQIERFIMNGARRGEFQLRVDYQSRSVVFDTDPFDSSQSLSSAAQLQASPSDLMRSQLSSLSICLSNAQRVACPDYVAEKQAQKATAIAKALQNMQEEHHVASARKLVIERRKEAIENAIARKERAEERERTIRMQREQELERQRMAEEKRQREADRLQKEREDIQRIEAKKLADSIKEKAGIEIDIKELEELDTTKLLELQVQQIEKEKQDMQTRLKAQWRKTDHTERAYRKCEQPLIADDYENQKKLDRKNHEDARKAQLAQTREKHEQDMEFKRRFMRMLGDFNAVRKDLDQGRSEALSNDRRRIREALVKAKEERIEEYRRLKAERDEAEAREREEREQREAEEERVRAAKAAELAKHRETMAAQRARDEELLKKRMERESELEKEREQRASVGKYVPPSRRAGGVVPPPARTGSASATPPSASGTQSPRPAESTLRPSAQSSNRYIPPSQRK